MSDPECSRCGRTLEPTARFCLQCGEARQPLSQQLRDALGLEYELMGELGRGGAAVVFSVRDKARKRYLAVKVIHPELMTSHTVVERFRREARYVAQLDHPNILSVVFSSEQAGLVFYAMPRISGKTLAKYLDSLGQLPVQGSLSILGQMAAGLHHAHEHGVIHRDVKPSNIMIEDRGHALILDFGVAKALWGNGMHLSASGEIIGSPRYMSPEQASGSSHIDHRTDIYSWGVVAFHMLAGRVPFDDEGVQAILYKQRSVEPPDLLALRPDLPRDLTEAVHRCLVKDPAHRWENVLDAARAMGCAV